MTERVTQAEFARRCGVNRSTVGKWIKSGRIHLGEDRKLDPEESAAKRLLTESPAPHHQARKQQIEQDKEEKRQREDDDSPEGRTLSEEVNLKLKVATMKERAAKADMAIMDRDTQAGKLVHREEVDFLLEDFGHTLRGLMESLPDRLTAELAGYRGNSNQIHTALESAGRYILEEVSAQLSRKTANLGTGGS